MFAGQSGVESMAEASRQERLIFVFDDEVGALVCKIAARNGFVARQFTEPLEFLTQIKLQNPDMIVLDLALGQTNAVEVIRELDFLQFKGKLLLISALGVWGAQARFRRRSSADLFSKISRTSLSVAALLGHEGRRRAACALCDRRHRTSGRN
jgi:DNA-binding response OmpR family regulator